MRLSVSLARMPLRLRPYQSQFVSVLPGSATAGGPRAAARASIRPALCIVKAMMSIKDYEISSSEHGEKGRKRGQDLEEEKD